MPSPSQPRLYIFGASGSGTTTLGARIAADRGCVHVDCDDHFWEPVDPPFSVRRGLSERITSMSDALGDGGWVLTGACNGWGDAIIHRADLIVFMTLPTPLRIKRILARENVRFGDRIREGGDMHHIHHDFINWAKGYDNPNFGQRNRAAHEEWLDRQTIPICRIDGDQSVDDAKARVDAFLQTLP